MSDRELLEMAAKAAGIIGCWLELDAEFKLDSPVISDGTKRYLWRPLQDDGDALRKDAERYRWLKVERRPAADLDAAFNTYGVPVDEAIDAAMAREAK